MQIGDIIRWLEERKVQVATQSLLQPSDTSTFGFGELVGRVRGLQEVLQFIEGKLEDEDRRERDQ